MSKARHYRQVENNRVNRACLKCGRDHVTTRFMFMCVDCRQLIKKTGADSGYDSHGFSFAGMKARAVGAF